MSKNSPLSGIKLPSQKQTIASKPKRVGRKPKKEIIDKNIPTPRSYRLNYNELDMLKDKSEEISQKLGRNAKISDTLVLRALIRLSNDIDDNDIIDKIKDIKMEM